MKPSTERDYRRRIARVIETIIVEPGAPHTVDSLAAVAHLSPFHFHRIYRAVTGETVAGTIQRSRLAQAAFRLKDGSSSVTDVALDVGYDSPQAFARAFRGFAGITPSEFRARLADLAGFEATPPSHAARAQSVGSEPIGASGVAIVELPPRDALCLRHQGPIATIGQTYRDLFRTLRLDDTSTQDVIGICFGGPGAAGGPRYHAGVAPVMASDPVGAIDPVDPVETVRLVGGTLCRLPPCWSLVIDLADVSNAVWRLAAAQRLRSGRPPGPGTLSRSFRTRCPVQIRDRPPDPHPKEMTVFLNSVLAAALCAAAWFGPAAAADTVASYHVGETQRVFHPPVARHWRGAETEGLVTTIWYPLLRQSPRSPMTSVRPTIHWLTATRSRLTRRCRPHGEISIAPVVARHRRNRREPRLVGRRSRRGRLCGGGREPPRQQWPGTVDPQRLHAVVGAGHGFE